MVKRLKSKVSALSPSKKGPLTQQKKPVIKACSKKKCAKGTTKGSLTPRVKVNRCKR